LSDANARASPRRPRRDRQLPSQDGPHRVNAAATWKPRCVLPSSEPCAAVSV